MTRRSPPKLLFPQSADPDAPPGAGRRLHGLLLLARPRHERRHDAARRGKRAYAELAAPARRLSRPCRLRWLSAARPCAGRSGRRSRRMPTRRSSVQRNRWTSSWKSARSSARAMPSANRCRWTARPSHLFGLRPGERLERTRHSGVGISAARSVSGKEFLHQPLAVGGHAGSARTFPPTRVRTRPGAIALPARDQRLDTGPHAGGATCKLRSPRRRIGLPGPISVTCTGHWRSNSPTTR